MVKHIVFMKLEDNSEENKRVIKEKLMSMKGKIETLKNIEVGLNFDESERAYDIALITDFKDIEGLKTYATHELHLPIVAYLKSINTVTKVVDFKY